MAMATMAVTVMATVATAAMTVMVTAPPRRLTPRSPAV